jgi:hypothetical protein
MGVKYGEFVIALALFEVIVLFVFAGSLADRIVAVFADPGAMSAKSVVISMNGHIREMEAFGGLQGVLIVRETVYQGQDPVDTFRAVFCSAPAAFEHTVTEMIEGMMTINTFVKPVHRSILRLQRLNQVLNINKN